MSNAEVSVPKQRVIGVPFKPGQSGNPSGRPKGSRNRLADAFVTDLRDCWELHGRDVLHRVARDEPAVLLKVIASLLPKTVDLNVALNASDFAERYTMALAAVG